MGARRSAQTEYAIKLVRSGQTIAQAARKTGLWWSTIRRALNADRQKALKINER